MKTTFRVIFALLLTLTLCFCVMPLAFAEGEMDNIVSRAVDYVTVTFDKNSNDAYGYMEAMQVTDTYAPLTTNAYTRDGYEFMGWNTDPDGFGTAFENEQIVSKTADNPICRINFDVTLYAQWAKIYKVHYRSNGGIGLMGDQKGISGVELRIGNNFFTKNDAAFDCWNTRPNGTGVTFFPGDKYTFDEDSQDLTLYAQWTYPVIFDSNGGFGSIQEMTVFEKRDFSIPSNSNYITRTGYAFIGWNTKADGTGDEYIDGDTIPASKVTGPITLYAQWDKEYTIIFVSNDGSNQMMEPQVILKSTLDEAGIEGVTLNANIFTRDNYIFTGWNTLAAGGGDYFDDEDKVRADDFDSISTLKLFAQWEHEIIITFKPGYDSSLSRTQSVAKGKAVKELEANTFIRTQYLFKNWKTDDGKIYVDKGYIPAEYVTNDFTLTAQWVGPLTIMDTVIDNNSVAYVGDTIKANFTDFDDDSDVTYQWYAKQTPTASSKMRLTDVGKTIIRTTIPKTSYTMFPYIYCVASKGSEENGTYQTAESNYILLKDYLDTVYWGMDFVNDGDITKYPYAQYYTIPGYIEGVVEGMEYSTDGGSTWKTITASEISGNRFLVPGTGTYIIRQGGVMTEPITIYNWYVVGYTVSSGNSAGGTVRMTASNSSNSSSSAMPSVPALADSTQTQRDNNTILRLASNLNNMWAVRHDNIRSITLSVQASGSESFAHVRINGSIYSTFHGNRTYSVSPVNAPKMYNVLFNLTTTNPTPDLILPSSLTAIEDEAFSGGAFTSVVLPDGAASIGRRAFADCPKLAYIYIPASVTSIDENAFDGAEGLTIFGAPESAASEYAGQHGFTFAAQQ